MPDAVAVLAGEGDRVDPADLQVAGVETPLDVGVLQRQGDIGRGLDDRPDVRVEDLGQAVGRADGVDLAQALADDRHPGRVERHGRRPVVVLDQRGDEAGGPGRLEELRDLGGAAQGVGPLGRVVQDERHEAADHRQAIARQQHIEVAGLLREEARGTEFGGGNAQLAHLAEHPVGRHDLTPAGHFADAPGDGRGGDAAVESTERGGHDKPPNSSGEDGRGRQSQHTALDHICSIKDMCAHLRSPRVVARLAARRYDKCGLCPVALRYISPIYREETW